MSAVPKEASAETKTVISDSSSRMLNLGEDVTLKKLGKVTVKELPLEDVIGLSSELILLVSSPNINLRAPAWYLPLLKDPQTFEMLCKIVAACCGKSPSDFVGMGLTDWLKIFNALKTVMDWGQLRELFFQLLPEVFTVKTPPQKV